MEKSSEYYEIDLMQLLGRLWQKVWVIVSAAVIGAVAAFIVAAFVIPPKYEAQALMYVNNSSFSVGSTKLSISSAELSAAQSLVDTYIVILNSRPTLLEVIYDTKVDYDVDELEEMISAEAVNNTEVFKITVTDKDPKEAELIANAIVDILPGRIADIVDGSSVRTVEWAVVPSEKSSPNITLFTLIGLLAGTAVSVMVLIIMMVNDTQIHNEDYLTRTYDLPILAVIPSLPAGIEDGADGIGDNLGFGASEAYKLLRTNLVFSMADEMKCKIIGMTSALRGEGKSTSSINLAYSLAESGKKVLLLEADMRIPVLADRLGIEERIGLSHVLAGIGTLNEAVRVSELHPKLFVLTAGEIPPNPSELLSSKRMGQVLEALAPAFEYIIVDLPPVNAVADGLAVSKLMSGMIVVIRQNYCDQASLAEAMRRMKLMDVKLLGFIMNDADMQEKRYKKYGYEYGYESAKS